LFKGDEACDLVNCRSISLTNVLYRVIFGRFAKVIQNLGKKNCEISIRRILYQGKLAALNIAVWST
jgi:hypothetical protein